MMSLSRVAGLYRRERAANLGAVRRRSQAALLREIAVLGFIGLAGASPAAWAQDTGAAVRTGRFPAPARPVAPIVSPVWRSEAERDRNREAERVFEILRIVPGMRVADIGAGTGYYTVRLAERLGPAAMIYAEDVDPGYLAELRARLDRLGIVGVTTTLGTPADPRLPPHSVDIAILSHMYHEIESPYEFLYNLQGALVPHGRVAVIDLDRPIRSHGTPPALLRCELEAVGYRQVGFYRLTPAAGYLAIFEPPDDPPEPDEIEVCDG